MMYLDNFHYQITGNERGYKLVFLHGLMGSGANWLKVVPEFKDQFHILTFDQRGHGRSFKPDAGYTPENFASDLAKILNDLGWKEIALVGHSMGGRNALEFAAKFSQRVKALVVEDIGPEATGESTARLTNLVQKVPTPFASRAAAKDYFDNGFGESDVLKLFFLSNIETKTDGTCDWRFSKRAILDTLRGGRARDRWNEWSELEMPVLLVRGENSRDLPRPMFERMLAELPAARGVEIADAGHWVHFEQLHAFVGALKEFFHSALGTNL